MGNCSFLEEEAMSGGGGGGGGGSGLWLPGSPRLSFSRDFVQSDVFAPSSARRDPAVIPSHSTDFDFGMLALLRDGLPNDEPNVELIHNGKLLPIDRTAATAATGVVAAPSPAAAVEESPRSSIGNDAEQEVEHQCRRQPPRSPASNHRWKDLLTLNFMRSSSSSSASIETEHLNHHHHSSSSSTTFSSRSSSSRLKLLFRSSSAGAGSRQQEQQQQQRDQQQLGDQIEPSLGRSASESKVSSCCNNLRVADGDLVFKRRPDSSPAPEDPPPIAATKNTVTGTPGTAQRPRPRRSRSSSSGSVAAPTPRKALAEVKTATAASTSTRSSGSDYQRLSSGAARSGSHFNPHQVLPTTTKGGGKSVGGGGGGDAWRLYSERMSNASGAAGGGNAGGNNYGVKVAEVLHMEVCMGQSTVVSKVAKAFTKKENAPSKISVRT